MELNNLLEEYILECKIRNYTATTVKQKEILLKSFIKYLENEFGIRKVEEVKRQNLQQYILDEKEKGNKALTINTKIKMARSMFKYALDENYINNNVFDRIKLLKQEKPKFSVFSDDEIKRMLKVWNERSYTNIKNKTIISLFLDCGIRCSELRNLKLDNIQYESIKILGKGNKWRVVPISLKTRKLMLKYERARESLLQKKKIECDYYFMNQYKDHIQDNSPIQKMVLYTANKANVRSIVRASPHSLRHYYAIKSLELGTPIHVLSRNLGHSSIKTTEIYLSQITNEQIEQEAIQKTKSPLNFLWVM